MRSRTRDEWLAAFADADVCLTTVYTRDEVIADPHLAARGVLLRDARLAPALGADTDALLDEGGIGEVERGRLRSSGVI